tara:strand:+ start:7917 stop:9059 length:1143 start_codon:yes stop_codon:yes gene_type:complete
MSQLLNYLEGVWRDAPESNLELGYIDEDIPYMGRLCCLRHARVWVDAFEEFFPKYDGIGDKVLVALNEGQPLAINDIDCSNPGELLDPIFSVARLFYFEQDRMSLVSRLGISPQAANVFLTFCPVGAAPHMPKISLLNGNLVSEDELYLNEEPDFDVVSDQITDQFSDARSLANTDSCFLARLRSYMPAEVRVRLFKKLGWDYIPHVLIVDDVFSAADLSSNFEGEINDPDIGRIRVESLPYFVHPMHERDVYFQALLTRAMEMQCGPILFLNSWPTQFRYSEQLHTVIGYFFIDNALTPCFAPSTACSVADMLVAGALFDVSSSKIVCDQNNSFFESIWAWKKKASKEPEGYPVPYMGLGNGWLIPDLEKTNVDFEYDF